MSIWKRKNTQYHAGTTNNSFSQQMKINRIAAFSDSQIGGNPAGVVLSEQMPSTETMQRIAGEVGYSETAFAQMQSNKEYWRVRYFSPESEVPFCGHATIALGAMLGKRYGAAEYQLQLNDAEISVSVNSNLDHYSASLKSPNTRHELLSDTQIKETLELFNYNQDQLSNNIPAARIHGGADHYVLSLKSRADLAAMQYSLSEGKQFMRERDIVTIMWVYAQTNERYHVRNAFASGGVMEDPATGAAAAAFTGYLFDAKLANTEKITLIQGEDMGSRSIITTKHSQQTGGSVEVSGQARFLI